MRSSAAQAWQLGLSDVLSGGNATNGSDVTEITKYSIPRPGLVVGNPAPVVTQGGGTQAICVNTADPVDRKVVVQASRKAQEAAVK